MTNTKILIVGDAAYLEQPLRRLGYAVCATVQSASRAIEEAAGTEPDLALVDLGPEGGADGLEAAERIGSEFGVPVVLLAAGEEEAGQGLFEGAWTASTFGCVPKPIEEKPLHRNIQAALALHRRETRHRETACELERRVTALQEQVALMKDVFDTMKEGVFANDETGRRLLVNTAALDVAGTEEPREIADWAEQYGIYLPDKETLVRVEQNPLVRCFHGETTEWAEFFVRNRQKPEGIHVGASARPLPTKVNGLAAGVVVFQDITESKAAQARLNESLNDLREQAEVMEAIFDSVRDGIIVSDVGGKFLYANPAAKEMLGDAYVARKDGLWSEKPTPYYYYSDRETPIRNEDLPLPRAVFQGMATDDLDIFVPGGRAGQGIFIQVNGRPLRDRSGRSRGGVITFHDVTRQVLADEALAQAFAYGRLEIVDTILHNIGNAINSVTVGIETVHRGIADHRLIRRLNALAEAVGAHRDDWADYIENDPQGQQVMPFITALAGEFVQEKRRLTATVDRVRERAQYIADIVRNQSPGGVGRLNLKDIDPRDTIARAIRLVKDSNRAPSTRVDIDCDKAPKEIRIDESRFEQMMVNLIKNAMEAIEQLAASGGLEEEPRISVRACADGDFLDIEVSDNGIGTAERDTRMLFAAGYTTKGDGTGLGLHSAANFVISSGGQIRLLSDGIGKGATAHVKLRLPGQG